MAFPASHPAPFRYSLERKASVQEFVMPWVENGIVAVLVALELSAVVALVLSLSTIFTN